MNRQSTRGAAAAPTTPGQAGPGSDEPPDAIAAAAGRIGRPQGLDGLPLPEPPIVPREIIGRDDRRAVTDTRLPPWRLVCHLVIERSDGATATATAWLGGPATVYTAGHNLRYTAQGHQAHRVWVVPGRAGNTAPFGVHEASGFDMHPRWKEAESPDADLGVLWLPSALGNSLGWFGFQALADAQLQGLAVASAGYPEDRPLGTQWADGQRIHRVESRMLAYGLDTVPGQSGSPVFVVDAQGRATALGVHVYGRAHENLGLRLTSDQVAQLTAWWR